MLTEPQYSARIPAKQYVRPSDFSTYFNTLWFAAACLQIKEDYYVASIDTFDNFSDGSVTILVTPYRGELRFTSDGVEPL